MRVIADGRGIETATLCRTGGFRRLMTVVVSDGVAMRSSDTGCGEAPARLVDGLATRGVKTIEDTDPVKEGATRTVTDSCE